MGDDDNKGTDTDLNINLCTFSPNNKHLATYSSKQGEIWIWKLDKNDGSFQQIWKSKPFEPNKNRNMSIALSNDGKIINLINSLFLQKLLSLLKYSLAVFKKIKLNLSH